MGQNRLRPRFRRLRESCRTSDCAPIGQLLDGRGQDSGASPVIWLLFMITMLRAFVKCSSGIQMTDPPHEVLQRSGHEFSQEHIDYSRHRNRFTPPETPVDLLEIDLLSRKGEKGRGGRSKLGQACLARDLEDKYCRVVPNLLQTTRLIL